MKMWMLGAAALVACNPPEGEDSMTLLIELRALEGGGAATAVSVYAEVDAMARTYDSEMEVGLNGLFAEEEELSIEFSVMEGLAEVAVGNRTGAKQAEDAVWAPDFAACTGDAFQELEDGGCAYSTAVVVTGDRVYTSLMDFTLRVQAPRGGDGEEVAVSIEADQTEPEA